MALFSIDRLGLFGQKETQIIEQVIHTIDITTKTRVFPMIQPVIRALSMPAVNTSSGTATVQ